MHIIKKIASFFLVAAFIYAIIILTVILFIELTPELTKGLIINASVAFFSAFFVFIFIKIGELTTIIRKRNTEHYSTLEKLKYILTKAIIALSSNIELLKASVDKLKKKKKITIPHYSIRINDDFLHDLLNIDFKSQLFMLFRDLEYTDVDMKLLLGLYNDLANNFLAQRVNFSDYSIQCGVYIQKMELNILYLTRYKEKAIRLLAITQVLLGEKKKKSFFFGFHVSKKYKKNLDKLVEEEIKEVQKDITNQEQEHIRDLEKIKEDIKSIDSDYLKLKKENDKKE